VLWGVLFIGFLDRIVESKYSNDFLVQIRLYLVMIWKKSKRGRNRFWLRYEIWFLVGLARVKAETLPRVGSGSRVGLVSRINWVRCRVRGRVRKSGEVGLRWVSRVKLG
jgi:hypothetical protein